MEQELVEYSEMHSMPPGDSSASSSMMATGISALSSAMPLINKYRLNLNRGLVKIRQMSQTYASKSKRYMLQRNEWVRSLQVHLTPSADRLLREFYKAAVLANEGRPDLSLEYFFGKLVDQCRTWSDDQMRAQIGETKTRDADICLQQAVKCHATVLSLSTATPCKQQLEVPTIVKFFRTVLEATVSDLSDLKMQKEKGISVFGTSDIAQRKRARAWIDSIIMNKCLEVVPVGMFARTAVPSPVVSDDEEEPAVVPATVVVPTEPAPATVVVPTEPAAAIVVAPAAAPTHFVAEGPAVAVSEGSAVVASSETIDIKIANATAAPAERLSDDEDEEDEEEDEDEEEEKKK